MKIRLYVFCGLESNIDECELDANIYEFDCPSKAGDVWEFLQAVVVKIQNRQAQSPEESVKQIDGAKEVVHLVVSQPDEGLNRFEKVPEGCCWVASEIAPVVLKGIWVSERLKRS